MIHEFAAVRGGRISLNRMSNCFGGPRNPGGELFGPLSAAKGNVAGRLPMPTLGRSFRPEKAVERSFSKTQHFEGRLQTIYGWTNVPFARVRAAPRARVLVENDDLVASHHPATRPGS